MLRLVPAVIGTVLLASLVAAAGNATAPGENGRMVFTADAGKHSQLFTIEPDGRGLKQVTRFKDGSDSGNANWSPDGKRIVFERGGPSEHAGVFTMSANGGDLRSLTRNTALAHFEGGPAYSRDGKWIVFSLEVHNPKAPKRYYSELMVMRADGTGRRQVGPKLTQAGGAYIYGEHSQFSPDGKRIVFIKQNPSRRAVFVVNVNGSGMKQVTPWSLGVDDRVDWSPDGSLILFSSDTGHSPVNVYTVRPDGTNITQITHSQDGNDSADSWSPDGKQIMLVRGAGGTRSLYVINADGTGMRQVTHGLNVHGGSWGTHP